MVAGLLNGEVAAAAKRIILTPASGFCLSSKQGLGKLY
jgi:hypothetical protein